MQSLPRYYPDHTGPLYDINTIIKSSWVHFLIFGCCIFGLLWSIINLIKVSKITVYGSRLEFYNSG